MTTTAANNVNGFYSYDNKMHFFPRGLDKLFSDLLFILIQKGPIKEVSDADMAPFTKLKSISLPSNEIEVIEDGIFQYNTELEVISLRNNKIFQIYPKVFENLNKVTHLYMSSNPCTNEYISNDKSGVLASFDRIKISCSNAKFLNSNEKLVSLKKDSKEINFDNFMTFKSSLEDFMVEFKSSNLSNSYIMTKIVNNFQNYLNTSGKWDLKLRNFTVLQNLKELGLENIKSDLKTCQNSFLDLKQQLLTFEQSSKSLTILKSDTRDIDIPKKFQQIEDSVKALNDEAFDKIESFRDELSISFNQKLSEIINDTIIESYEKLETVEKHIKTTIEQAFHKIDNTNSVMQNSSKAFEERIKAIENELKFPTTIALVRTGLAINKIYNLHDISQKIDDIQSEIQNGSRSFDEKLKFTESFLKASDAKALKKIESIDRAVKASIDAAIEKNENFQSETRKASRKLEKKLLDQEDLINESIENVEKTQINIQNDLKRSEERIENLEKALKQNQESLTSFRSEMLNVFNKILEKLEGSSENFERFILERIESRSLTEQSYLKSSAYIINERITNLEKNLNDLRFDILGKQNIMCESCDSD